MGDANTDWQWGLTAGFLAGFGWAAAIFTVIALFEQKSWKYILINAGLYHRLLYRNRFHSGNLALDVGIPYVRGAFFYIICPNISH